MSPTNFDNNWNALLPSATTSSASTPAGKEFPQGGQDQSPQKGSGSGKGAQPEELDLVKRLRRLSFDTPAFLAAKGGEGRVPPPQAQGQSSSGWQALQSKSILPSPSKSANTPKVQPKSSKPTANSSQARDHPPHLPQGTQPKPAMSKSQPAKPSTAASSLSSSNTTSDAEEEDIVLLSKSSTSFGVHSAHTTTTTAGSSSLKSGDKQALSTHSKMMSKLKDDELSAEQLKRREKNRRTGQKKKARKQRHDKGRFDSTSESEPDSQPGSISATSITSPTSSFSHIAPPSPLASHHGRFRAFTDSSKGSVVHVQQQGGGKKIGGVVEGEGGAASGSGKGKGSSGGGGGGGSSGNQAGVDTALVDGETLSRQERRRIKNQAKRARQQARKMERSGSMSTSSESVPSSATSSNIKSQTSLAQNSAAGHSRSTSIGGNSASSDWTDIASGVGSSFGSQSYGTASSRKMSNSSSKNGAKTESLRPEDSASRRESFNAGRGNGYKHSFEHESPFSPTTLNDIKSASHNTRCVAEGSRRVLEEDEESVESYDQASSSLDAFFANEGDFLMDERNKLKVWQGLCLEVSMSTAEMRKSNTDAGPFSSSAWLFFRPNPLETPPTLRKLLPLLPALPSLTITELLGDDPALSLPMMLLPIIVAGQSPLTL